ncbi:MAG TPA: hypothetical protein VJP80_02935 [Candidatus Saccharimonadales bacterium]|nr:hypothetical protein [Candidatus Saccharimonadales bacterium]
MAKNTLPDMNTGLPPEAHPDPVDDLGEGAAQYRDMAAVLDAAPATHDEPMPETAETPTTIEARKLDALLRRHNELLGAGYEIRPVGELGFVIDLKGEPAVTGNDWVFFDLDDTTIAYSKAKEARLEAYTNHVTQELGFDLDPAIYKRVLDVTDRFSRWEENGEDAYHVNAHIASASWMTNRLKGLNPDEAQQAVSDMEAQLARIKQEQSGVAEARQEDDPFHFEGNKFVHKSLIPWSRGMEEVFRVSMVKPPSYEGAVESITALGRPVDGQEKVNVGAFTYGEPPFQLTKILELMQAQAAAGESLPFSQIWLTKAPKGDFVAEIAAMSASEQDEVFGGTPHSLIVVDDDPKVLESLIAHQPTVETSTAAMVGVMRSIREGTKTESRPWAGKPVPEVENPSAHSYNADAATLDLATRVRMAFVDKIGYRLKEDDNEPSLDPTVRQQLVARYNGYADQISATYQQVHDSGRLPWVIRYEHLEA